MYSPRGFKKYCEEHTMVPSKNWYVLNLVRKVELNEDKSYSTLNRNGRKYSIPFKLSFAKEKNAELFIAVVENLYPILNRVLAEEERECSGNRLHRGDVQELCMRVEEYVRSFHIAFNRDVCKSSSDELPRKLYECYQNLTHFTFTMGDLLEKERIHQRQEELRKDIEKIPKYSHTADQERKLTRMMNSYEQMQVDRFAAHYASWKAKQVAKISAWKERALKEEQERYDREVQKYSCQIEFHEQEILRLSSLRENEKGVHEDTDKCINVRSYVYEKIETHPDKCPPMPYCKECDYHAPTLAILKRHLESKKHNEPKKDYYCECCDYRARDKTNMDKHLASNKHQKKVSEQT